MKQIFSLLAGMCIVLSSLAQTASTGKITGSIKDGGNQKIIDAASVTLLRAKDSSIAKTAIADKDGNFSFENIKDGNYLVLATSVGHSKSYSAVFTINASQPTAQV